MSKVKSLRTLAEEELEIDFSKVLSMSDKVTLMDKMLMLPMHKIDKARANGKLPSFVQSCATMLWECRLSEYFEVLDRCRKIAAEDKEAKKGASFI